MKRLEHEAEFIGKGEKPKRNYSVPEETLKPKSRSKFWPFIKFWLVFMFALPFAMLTFATLVGTVLTGAAIIITCVDFLFNDWQVSDYSQAWKIALGFAATAASGTALLAIGDKYVMGMASNAWNDLFNK